MHSLLVCGSAFCFSSWCKFTIEQIYCNLSVNLRFPAEWGRGQQGSAGTLAIAVLHMQLPDSQKQGANSREEKQITQQPSDQPIDDQKRNCLKTNITRNLLSDGQIYTPHTAALLWRCALILLHFKAAVQGCWVLALSKRNGDYVVPYVRQLKQRIPGLTRVPCIKTTGAGEVGAAGRVCSRPSTSGTPKTNAWVLLLLPSAEQSSSFLQDKGEYKAKPFGNYFLM